MCFRVAFHGISHSEAVIGILGLFAMFSMWPFPVLGVVPNLVMSVVAISKKVTPGSGSFLLWS